MIRKSVYQCMVCLSAFVLLSSCGSNALKPEDAQKMICARYNLPKVMSATLQNGTIRFIRGSGLADSKKLANAGIVTCDMVQESDGRDQGVYQINLAAGGNSIKLKDTTDEDGRSYFIFKTSDKVFGSISEITHSEDGNSANVNYSIEYINTNPVFDVFGVREKRQRVKADKDGKYIVRRQARFNKNEEGAWVMQENQKTAKDYMNDMNVNSLRRSSNSIATDDPNDVEY